MITITGTSGFVGQNLIQYLKLKNYKINPLSLRKNDWKNNFDPNSTTIIHLAGKAHDTKNTSAANEYFEINTELTKQLFDLFLQSDAKDFFYFSSVKAVADSVEGTLTENVIPNPKTPYGKSKFDAEKYILSREIPAYKRVFILRPCMIHGPGNKGNLNLLYKIVSKGIPWPLGDFENKRSFLSIENLCFVINELLENKNIESGVFNLADNQAISTNELIVLIANATNKNIRIWKISKKMIVFIAKIGTVLNLPLNSERLQKLTESYVVSNKKIIEAIQKPLPVETKKGLIETLKSF